MDYLDEWKDFMIAEKWRLGEVANPRFIAIESIYVTLRSFYNQEDFAKDKNNPDNWIIHVLANKHLNSLYILGEHCALIQLYNSNNEFRTLNLKTADGKTNHRELNEKLFELYVNAILRRCGAPPQINRSYQDHLGNVKPMDLVLFIDGDSINIEVTKFYDSFKEELLTLTLHLQRRVTQIALKKKMKVDELFSGFLLLKTRDTKSIRNAKSTVESKILEHIENFRNPVSQVIKSATRITTKEIELVLEPAYLDQFSTYKARIGNSLGALTFQLELNHKTGLVRGNFNVQISSSDDIQNEYLVEKIKEKIEQHKSFPGPKVIVIGIDNVFTTHKKGRTAAILRDQVNRNLIVRKLPRDTIVLLIFKDILPNKIEFSKVLLSSSAQHPALLVFEQLTNQHLILF